jgi:hypothetical protein
MAGLRTSFLAKAQSLLHAQHCSRGDQGRVVATINDYRAVHKLIADQLVQNTDCALAENVQETLAAVASLQASNPLGDGLTYQQLANQLGLDKSAARCRVNVNIEKNNLGLQFSLRGYGVDSGSRQAIPTGKNLPMIYSKIYSGCGG